MAIPPVLKVKIESKVEFDFRTYFKHLHNPSWKELVKAQRDNEYIYMRVD